MKKLFFVLMLLSGITDYVNAAEVHSIDGNIIHGKIIRVSEVHVEYKTADNNRLKKFPRSRVSKIVYDDGTTVIFSSNRKIDKTINDKKIYDEIHLENDIILKGKITRVTANTLYYIPYKKKKIEIISKDKVIKIVYPNGKVVSLKGPLTTQPKKNSYTQKKGKITFFETTPYKKLNKPRSVVWIPLLTFFVPGLDQWWEGQYRSGLFYSGIAILGISMMSPEADTSGKQPFEKGLTNEEKKTFYGAQLYQTAGSLSTFQCFRTAVKTHQESGNGRFSFLKEEETTDDVLLAPFKLTFLARPTTFIPLGLLSGLVAIALSGQELNGMKGRDFLYASGLSYNAGTGEEAVFRGWMMPLLMDYTDSGFWSNTITALLFAAMHISSDLKYPVAQFAAGWYLGWVAQRRNWTISESVFIHAWWDLIIFTTMYFTYESEDEEANIVLPLVFLKF